MSFIYKNNNLINDLIKCGLDFENKFIKKAQTATTDSRGNNAAIALKLLGQIENTSQSNVSSSLNNIDLKITDFKDLQTLIVSLAQSQIMIGLQRIALDVPNDENNNVPAKPGYVIFKALGRDFYVNKDLLVKYLQSLQPIAHEKIKQMPFFETQLKSLINEAQDQLGVTVPEYTPTASGSASPKIPGQDQSTGTINPVEFDKLFNVLPLNDKNINLSSIKLFLTKCNDIFKSSDLSSTISNCLFDVDAALVLHQNRNIIDLNPALGSDEQYKRIMMDLNGRNNYFLFIEKLQKILNAINQILLYVNNTYGKRLGDKSQKLQEQISHGNSNANELSGLEDAGKRLIKMVSNK